MNAYGFAGGDRINFTDPFGLCPPIESCLALAGAGGATVSGVASGGTALGGIGAGAVAAAAPAAVALGGFAGGYWIGTKINNALEFAGGLSWWDKMRLKIKIVIGAATTEGELQERLIDRERRKADQVQEVKEKGKETGDGKKKEPDKRGPNGDR